MPQPGIHALLALMTRKAAPRQPLFFLGVIFGTFIPELDGYLHLIGIFTGMPYREAVGLYERTITHSLFFAAGVLLLVLVVGRLRRRPDTPIFAAGLAVGMIFIHILVDVFFWFETIGLLWPFWSVNLWGWVHLPIQVIHVLEAANYFAFAMYFIGLIYITRRNSLAHGFHIRLRQFTGLMVTVGVLFTLLAITRPPAEFRIFNDCALLLFAYPMALWVTWKLRHALLQPRHTHTRHSSERHVPMEWLDVDWG